MERLEIRLLGGFDLRLGDRPVLGFESQKVRALFAYLACHRGQAPSRDRLASLLWGEKSDTAARRNLRQALHNLKSVFAAVDESVPVVRARQKTLQLDPALDLWLDVDEFQLAIRRGLTEAGPDPYQLATAARLYTGDFLAGFFIKESPEFEEWMISEQERLREAAIESYGTLIDAYLSRGEYRLGIQFARRLLAIDPLSEGAHRNLMRLYALSGRRTRALTQFERLRRLLMTELGVEPMEETVQLYESILVRDLPLRADEEEEPVGPLIPLVGRAEAYGALQERWNEVVEGRGGLTLLEGEPGVGKTRLAKSFVDAANSKRRAIVLRGRSYERAPRISYQPFSEVVTGAFVDVLPEEHEDLARELSDEARAGLLTIAPDLSALSADLDATESALPRPGGTPEALATALIEFLETLARLLQEARERIPVILLIDDLQWADEASLGLLRELIPRIGDRPIWVLAGTRPDGPARLAGGADSRETPGVDVLRLERLDEAAMQEIAFSLVGSTASAELAALLAGWSEGLPLAAAELVNYLWDEGILAPRGAGRWFLQAAADELPQPPASLHELIQLRVRRLPNSTRRLLAVAATLGQQFDAGLLRQAAGEHIEVVEIGLQLMLERWLIRQFQTTWSSGRREPDLVAWSRGARRGSFEFAHEAVREAILDDINPLRRQTLHRAVAGALRQSRGNDLNAICEQLAFHELEAGDWELALPCVEAAAVKARSAAAADIARWYEERAVEVLDRLLKQPSSDAERERFLKKRRALKSR